VTFDEYSRRLTGLFEAVGYDPQDTSLLQNVAAQYKHPVSSFEVWKQDYELDSSAYKRGQDARARRLSMIWSWVISALAACVVFECVVAYFLP
jgi:hypothetical protein